MNSPRRTLKALVLTIALLSTLSASVVYADPPTTRYEVTITNLTQAQPFTPPVIATHNPAFQMFRVGNVANEGVKEVAENGNVPALVSIVENSSKVSDFVVAVAGNPPPLFPGASVTVEINGDRSAKVLSTVAMLICTNDGFAGIDSMRLPKKVGETTVEYFGDYDAGTEINTEDFSDIVPPCSALTGVPTTKTGTGMSNPALAENGVITHHPGINGGVDLVPSIHDWSSPVAKIVVKRIQ